MTEKRVSVRLVAEGGRQVRAEFDSVSSASKTCFGGLSQEVDRANARLAEFARRARLAAIAAAGALAAASVAMIRSGLQTVDAQAKLAQSLGTTVASIQTLERAGELAGVSMSGIEQATKDLTRRLSQAAAGTGPAADALDRLGLSANELIALPLDQRVGAINAAIERFVPAAERAAVAGQLFGEEGSIAMSRIDTATLRQATRDVHDFGVVVSEQDADQIERTNDAISRLGLIWRGLANQLAVAAAPALEAVADAMAAVARTTGPLGIAIRGLFDNLGRLAAYAATFAAFLAGRWVAGLAAAAVSVRGLATALVVLRGALIRTGIGALIVGAGELVYWFGRLVRAAGGFGEAFHLLGRVAVEVWGRIGFGAQALGRMARSVAEGIQAAYLRAFEWILRKFAAVTQTVAAGVNALFAGIGMELGLEGMSADAADAIGRLATEAEQAARLQMEAAGVFTRAALAPLESLQALRDAMVTAGEDGAASLGDAAAATEEVEDAMDAAGGAAGRAGAAAKEAGEDAAEAAEAAKTGWEAVRDALTSYAGDAMDWGKGLGETLTGWFRSAENAFADFVKTGKFDFREMVTSMLADLARLAARRFILGPIANALSGVMGGGGFATGFAGGQVPGVYDRGGHTGFGARTGGLDGMGGRLAIVHPRERIIDETRAPRAVARPVYVTINTPDVAGFARSRAQVQAEIARAVQAGQRGL